MRALNDHSANGGPKPTAPTPSFTTTGLRMTRQRQTIAQILHADPQRHLSAEDVMAAATAQGETLSLATVYNTLNAFASHGLLRKVTTAHGTLRYDTTPGDHHHFHNDQTGTLTDIPPGILTFATLPNPPAGHRITGIDVVIRIEPEEG